MTDTTSTITQIPGYGSIAAAARALYGGRAGALQQMIRKIEKAAGFPIINRSSSPLTPTDAGRELIREARQVLQAARQQAAPRASPGRVREEAGIALGRGGNPSAASSPPGAV